MTQRCSAGGAAACGRGLKGSLTMLHAAVVFLLLASGANAVEVPSGGVRWGFDGKLVAGRTGILSVQLVNRDKDAFDGEVALVRSSVGGYAGAPEVQSVFVSPGAVRWVQFYPCVEEDGESWELRLGGQRVRLPPCKVGPPATVVLSAPEERGLRASGLPLFDEGLFPVSVCATDGLWAVVLDHAPRWEPSRRAAFMDWLRRGGTVHLLHDAQGGYPVFSGPMDVLNRPGESFHVGAGLVVRHPVTRRGLDGDALAAGGLAEREDGTRYYGSVGGIDRSIFQRLASFTIPRHKWWLIIPLLLVYIVAVGPLNLILARRVKDYRHALVCLVGTVALFGAVLSLIGRRGFGEAAGTHSLTYARAIEPGRYDVTQWASAFATSSGSYEITYDSPHDIFSIPSWGDPLEGAVRNGADGRLQMRMPLFSSRAYVYRGKLSGPRLSARVVRMVRGQGLEELEIDMGDEFPGDPINIYALYRDKVYTMQAAGGRLRLGAGQEADQFLDYVDVRDGGGLGIPFDPYYSRPGGLEQGDARLRDMVRPLMARAVWAASSDCEFVDPVRYRKDAIQLFIYAKGPPEFGCVSRRLGQHRGYVLYHIVTWER